MELDSRPCRGQFGCVDLCSSYEIDGTHARRLDGGETEAGGEKSGRDYSGCQRHCAALCARSITFLITKIPEVINFACIT